MQNRSLKMVLTLTLMGGAWFGQALAQPDRSVGEKTPTVRVPLSEALQGLVIQAPSDPPVGTEILVLMKSGRQLRGYFVGRAGRQLILRIGTVEARVPENQVDRVVPQRPAIDRYRDMRLVIDDRDIDRLLALIDWLRANKLYDVALTELAHVRSLEPDHPDVIRLQKLIEQEVRLRDKSTSKDPGSSSASPHEVRSFNRLKPGDFPLLTPEQVNLLKIWELDLNNPPPMRIDRAVVNEFLDRFGDDPAIPTTQDGREAFHRRSPVAILSEMFRLRARDLYNRVEVTGLPKSLELYRDSVNSTWLLNNCSTTRCHGGLEAGRLMLNNRHANAERPAMTNFLILDRSTLSDGRPLIDYENPARSPLLQLGLPRQDSAFAHPVVKGWRPVFRTMDARRFVQAVEWIRAMREPHSSPPIDYSPPIPPDADKFRKKSEPQPR